MVIDPETLGSFQFIAIMIVVSIFNFAAGQALHAIKDMFRLSSRSWQRAVASFLTAIVGLVAIAWLIVSLGLKVS